MCKVNKMAEYEICFDNKAAFENKKESHLLEAVLKLNLVLKASDIFR